ncbi:MAG: hypothetical protein ACXWPM_03420 [Bdellovibrionota bacterium]
MASRQPKTPEKAPSLLPLPGAMLEHHARTLFGPMKEWRRTKRLPPVLLLTGTEGIGKRAVTHFLAQWILCERSGVQAAPAEGEGGGLFGAMELAPHTEIDPASDPVPCGECVSCQRALHGSWVDFTEILAEEETLKIDQFRKLKSTMGFGAHEGQYRITVIPDADRMTTQAANSLLKLLEEPPAGWIFFLTSSDPTLLLTTITSRCQTLRLKPFSRESLLKLLEDSGVAPEKRALCAELAQGSFSQALGLGRGEVFEQRQELFEFLKSPESRLETLVNWAATEPANFDLLLDQLEQITADLVRTSATGAEYLGEDGKAALLAHAKRMTARLGAGGARAFWTNRAERIARARRESLAPLNRKLLTQDILMAWLG